MIKEELSVDIQTIDAALLSKNVFSGSEESGSKERVDQRAERVSGSGW